MYESENVPKLIGVFNRKLTLKGKLPETWDPRGKYVKWLFFHKLPLLFLPSILLKWSLDRHHHHVFHPPRAPLLQGRPCPPHLWGNPQLPPRGSPQDLRHKPQQLGERYSTYTPFLYLYLSLIQSTYSSAGTENENKSLEEIIKSANGPLFNNAAQTWNHTFYWHSLSPNGGGEADGAVKDAIVASWGSFDTFKQVLYTFPTILPSSPFITSFTIPFPSIPSCV